MSTAKKQLKKAVNETGAFLQIPFSVVETNAVDAQVAAQMPDDCFLFKGIASTGDLNRNDYIIRESAWVNALPQYMQNPIILFQHEPKEAIGNTIDARVTSNGLEVVGYIRRIADSTYAAGNIEAGVYRALSTGHLTTDFEFENSKTSQIISKDEFKAMAEEQGWFGKWAEDWKMAVTALEFVEWSVVSLPSNAAALRTSQSKEILKNFYQINDSTPKVEIAPESEPENEGETPEADEAVEEVKPVVPSETPVAPVATPPVVEPVATQEAVKAEVVSTNSVEVKETLPSVNVALPDVVQPPQVNYMELIETQSKQIETQSTQITTLAQALVDMQKEFGTVKSAFDALRKVVDQIPAKRGLIAMSQFAEVKKPVEDAGAKQLKNLFGRVGVGLKD